MLEPVRFIPTGLFPPMSRVVQGPCWHCHHFVARVDDDTAFCSRELAPRVRTAAHHGCSGFEREPGADDEPAASPEPVGLDAAWRLAPPHVARSASRPR